MIAFTCPCRCPCPCHVVSAAGIVRRPDAGKDESEAERDDEFGSDHASVPSVPSTPLATTHGGEEFELGASHGVDEWEVRCAMLDRPRPLHAEGTALSVGLTAVQGDHMSRHHHPLTPLLEFVHHKVTPILSKLVELVKRVVLFVHQLKAELHHKMVCPVLQGPCAVLQGPFAVLQGPCAVLQGPCAVLEDPCAVLQGPCTVLEDPCAVLEGPCAVF